jgi:hypothetical protein
MSARDSTRRRLAASSSGRGRPSSRWQISTTRGSESSSSTKPGRASRARFDQQGHGAGQLAVVERHADGGYGQGGEEPDRLAGNVQRLSARGQDVQAGAAGQGVKRRRGRSPRRRDRSCPGPRGVRRPPTHRRCGRRRFVSCHRRAQGRRSSRRPRRRTRRAWSGRRSKRRRRSARAPGWRPPTPGGSCRIRPQRRLVTRRDFRTS